MEGPLPNWELAVIPDSKLRDYVLNPDHPIGGPKSWFFSSVLGFDTTNWVELRVAVLSALPHFAEGRGATDEFGMRYEVLLRLTGPTGRSASVLTVWIVRPGADAPQLITMHPG